MNEKIFPQNVIIVDDDPLTLLDLKNMLMDTGIKNVLTAQDGFDAVKMCKNNHPDLVLMDIKMPVFDGLSAAETIMSESLCDCVILITAYNDFDFLISAIQLGVGGFINKPIDPRTLIPTILIGLSNSRRIKMLTQDVHNEKRKVAELKIIEQAKALIAKEENISESQAYQKLQRMAMDKKCTIVYLANQIVESKSERSKINYGKRIIMEKYGISEQAAFKKIKNYAEVHKCSMLKAVAHFTSKSDSPYELQ